MKSSSPDLFLTADDIACVIDTVKEAGELAQTFQNNRLAVSRKTDATIVTEADFAVQDFLLFRFKSRFPDFNFIHEENFNRESLGPSQVTRSFIIDPIDGTALYSMGLPFWSVSVGIFKGLEPVYGFVYSPGCSMFFHSDGEKSYLNGTVLVADESMIIDTETTIFTASEVQKKFSLNFPGKIRNLGSTALHASLIADNKRNRALGFIGNSSLWDWAGAFPILKNAGVTVHYCDGTAIDLHAVIANRYEFPGYLVAYSSVTSSEIKKIITML